MGETCGICGARTIPISVLRRNICGDRSAIVLDEFSVCTLCQSELYAPGQAQAVTDRVKEALAIDPEARYDAEQALDAEREERGE